MDKIVCQYGADLKSCFEESNQPKICIINNESYQKPFPVTVRTQLFLREFVNIDEEKNLISIQMVMFSTWPDQGLDNSNNTIR